MDEDHYQTSFYFRHESVVLTDPDVRSDGLRSGSPDEETSLITEYEEYGYGTEEIAVEIRTGSGKLRRAGSQGYEKVRQWVNVYGPGLVVMLAASDASSLVTSAEIGKEWGYAMVVWELLLVYPLFLVQELTVRLGAATKLGHAQLIRRKYGPYAAWFCVIVIIITCVASVVSQLTAVIGIAASLGLNPTATCYAIVSLFALITVGGHSKKLEKVCLCLGLCEVVFIFAMLAATPSPAGVAEGVVQAGRSLTNTSYGYLLAAYVGSTLTPWMMFYEQSAVCDKELTVEEVPAGRKDTFLGACLCQAICCAVTLTTAAKSWSGSYELAGAGGGFSTIADVAAVLSPVATTTGRGVVFLGFLGASLNCMLCVAMTAVFSLAEVANLKVGKKSFLQHTVAEQPVLYAAFVFVLFCATVVATQGTDMVALNLTASILNTLLLPIAMFFLVSLAADPRLMPPCLLLKGWHLLQVSLVLMTISVGSVMSFILSVY